MRPLVVRLRGLYGAGPLHLLLMLGAVGLAAYAVLELGLDALWDPDTWWQSIAVWFVGAALVHDLVLFPAYALADRALAGRWLAGRLRDRPRGARERVPVVNHVRVPLLASALTFGVFYPGIVQQGSDAHLRATGLTQDPYLERWLLLCAAFFLTSALVYGVRQVTAPRRRSGQEPGTQRVG